MQRDFVYTDGALYVPKAETLIKPIVELADHSRYRIVIATKDWHPSGHRSFNMKRKLVLSEKTGLPKLDPNGGKIWEYIKNEDKESKWPVHCVGNSKGARLVPELLPIPHYIVLKGTDSTQLGYSALERGAKSKGGPYSTILDMVKGHKIKTVDVVGVALEHCVKATAIDLAKANVSTRVRLRFTKAMDRKAAKDAIEEMEKAGVRVTER